MIGGNDMSDVVVITGANRGIGLELAKQYSQRGAHVIGLVRESSSELSNCAGQVIEGVDVSNLDSILRAKSQMQVEKIDILINNAGLLTAESLDDMSFERIQRQLDINTLGPLKVTSVLLPFLEAGSKCIMMTSRMGSIADNESGSRYGYRLSKAALNAASKSLAIDLKPKGIIVGICHPGWVQTEMTGHTGHLTAPESASALMDRISEFTLEMSGTFMHSNGERLPW